MMTPQDVLGAVPRAGREGRRSALHGFSGAVAALHDPRRASSELEVFEDGLGFDGSSIRGWQAINESDMLLLPDPNTAIIDPFCTLPTLSMICNIQDPITREDYSRDPRNVARKAVNYLKSTGVADTCFIGPEAEFFIFDDVRFDQTPNCGFFYHRLASRASGTAAPTKGPNLGYKLRHKEGYFPVPPADQLMDIRNEMMQTMIDCGIDVEAQHHEVATAGQSEIDMRFTDLVTMADQMCMYKYIIKNVARKHGKTVTFMPKPLFSDNGSGMHTHISFWKDGQPLFAGNGYAGLSDEAMYAHRRHPGPRPGDSGVRLPDDQQLQAARAGVRGAGEPGVFAAQPLGGVPHSDVQPEPQGQADRVPLPRPELQSVPGVLGADDGGARRHPEQDPPGRAAGQGHLRPRARGAGQSADDAGLAGRGARRAGEGPRVPAPRRRVHAGRDQHVDLVQEEERGAGAGTAAASVRVLPVLRHLNKQASGRRASSALAL